MRRTSLGADRTYRAYDPLQDVDPERLKLIGGTALAWNWIEGAIDAALSVALDLHPTMWNEVTTRINGLDAKFALLKKFATLNLADINPAVDDTLARMRDTIGQVSALKKLRDGVVHVRLTAPEEMTGDIPVGKGGLHEVLVSGDALAALYARMAHYTREMDWVTALFFAYWMVTEGSTEEKRQSAAADFREYQVQLKDLQMKRSALPPLPEFPASPPTLPNSEAEPELRG